MHSEMTELNADRLKDPARRALSRDNIALGLNAFLAGAFWSQPTAEITTEPTAVMQSAKVSHSRK